MAAPTKSRKQLILQKHYEELVSTLAGSIDNVLRGLVSNEVINITDKNNIKKRGMPEDNAEYVLDYYVERFLAAGIDDNLIKLLHVMRKIPPCKPLAVSIEHEIEQDFTGTDTNDDEAEARVEGNTVTIDELTRWLEILENKQVTQVHQEIEKRSEQGPKQIKRVTTPLRDYTKIEEKNCQLVTHYGGKKFNCPHDVAIGPNDEVVIIDISNKEVIIFDKDLKLIRTFGQHSGDSKLDYSLGVAVGHNVIAVSEFSDHVKKFSLQGDYLSKFGSRGSGDGQFINPQGLCFNSKGLLYVVDNGNCRVQVFRENVFLFKFGSKGNNPGQFQYPCYIAVDSSDQVYVTDCSTCSNDDGGVRVFSEDGHFIKRINCNRPYIICIAPDDHIIAKVNPSDSITVFSPTNECIGKFGVRGKEKGQFSDIRGIAINNSGTIFVAEGNNGNSRLQIITS